MFKHILVPLDGSTLSEAAIPISIVLAEKLKAIVTLLHIIEHDAPQTIHGENHIKTFEEATAYLKKIVKNKYPADIKVKIHIHPEGSIDVVKAIADHHKELSSDLLVMTTHGWGGLKEIFYGNNAQRILNLGIMPVLFIPPNFSKHVNQKYIDKILVPVDAIDEHKLGLETAITLASKCPAELFLINVIPTLNTLSAKNSAIGMLLPRATREVLEIQRKDAEHYIAEKIKEIGKKGIKVFAEISRGDPAKIISKIANKKSINFIVLGTHGKAGLNAFWSESIAAKITKKTKTAILFVPVREK